MVILRSPDSSSVVCMPCMLCIACDHLIGVSCVQYAKLVAQIFRYSYRTMNTV